MSYKVTVIIPSYNSEKFLDSTIESVMNQSIGFENIELIIIDDYSTDNTKKLIEEYCSKYDNIKTYESGKKTGTPGRARNIGIANSNGKYIMFLDHDDRYLDNTVEKLYNSIENNSVDISIGKFQTFGDGKITSDPWIVEDTILNSIDENKLFLSINNIWRMIFPKDFLLENQITFPESVFAEDLSFMIDSFLSADKIMFIDEIVYNFRLRTGDSSSTSLSKGLHYLNGLIEGYNDTYAVLKKHNACKYYDTIFNQHLSCWLNDLTLSETIPKEDKFILLEKSVPLFKKMKNVEPYPKNDEIKEIILYIQKEEIDKAYILMHMYKEVIKKTRFLEIQLNQKREQVAYLQTTKGWFKYKTKNILDRLKNKF